MPITTLVFDAYGTLFDVNAAARLAATKPEFESFAPLWPRLAEDWRRKQLEYTWLRSLMGQHADFATITADSLDWAMAAQGLHNPFLRAELLSLYLTLPAYPEVPAMLTLLHARGLKTAILSNGTPQMLAAAVNSAKICPLLTAVLSIEEVGIYKPAPAVYGLVERQLGSPPEQTLFVSANGWDIAGAGAFGFATLWVNRAGLPQDCLPHRPAHIASDLSVLPQLLDDL